MQLHWKILQRFRQRLSPVDPPTSWNMSGGRQSFWMGRYQFVALPNPRGDILEVNRAALEGAGHRIEDIR